MASTAKVYFVHLLNPGKSVPADVITVEDWTPYLEDFAEKLGASGITGDIPVHAVNSNKRTVIMFSLIMTLPEYAFVEKRRLSIRSGEDYHIMVPSAARKDGHLDGTSWVGEIDIKKM